MPHQTPIILFSKRNEPHKIFKSAVKCYILLQGRKNLAKSRSEVFETKFPKTTEKSPNFTHYFYILCVMLYMNIVTYRFLNETQNY